MVETEADAAEKVEAAPALVLPVVTKLLVKVVISPFSVRKGRGDAGFLRIVELADTVVDLTVPLRDLESLDLRPKRADATILDDDPMGGRPCALWESPSSKTRVNNQYGKS